ncbi:4Fe-4S dicluster domain-containing protein [Aquabacterium sp. A08]|uniref:4Fe-4S dicluster domain-containing protein n=1 Tax=Aquabacterium sp. A08 TaxID=2718532 RepID=UPI001422C0E2|nr:4Fe-4S dicluster domain-containing protein [Aquabacterium sp. A08]NIC40461.1 4Fe-4S binding protein [Aquabacterium sp. A08]
MPLDGAALGQALGEGPLAVHTTLCRREAPAFQRATRSSDDLTVACTQEQRLFTELSAQTEGAVPLEARPIRFVNLRETGGWGREAARATPKMAALLAAARLPDPEPVPTVTYRSAGRLLIIGPLDRAEALAAHLDDALQVTLFATGGAGRQERRHPVLGGELQRVSGWLGAFSVAWSEQNPIALDLCTRCNACVAACPESAIGLDYQVNLDACRSHRDCVRVCEAPGAIDFQRAPVAHEDTFDLVLDLRPQPAFTQHALPQGYLHLPPQAGADAQLAALLQLRERVGEFEKPKFFHYQQRLCAHGRNERVGCNACVEVCSASAISSQLAQQRIQVNPQLCVGCGACTTVCPTGALGYAYPSAAHQGRTLRTLLSTYARAGGRHAALLLHSQGAGQQRLQDWGRAAQLDRQLNGVPARVLPVALWHTASVGLELWLSAIAQGASQVWLLTTDEEAPDYLRALREQMDVAEALLQGLGYSGEHFRLLHARDARDLAALDAAAQVPPAATVRQPATFAVQADKRATLELALDHLVQQSPLATPPAAIALPAAGAPLGTVEVDRDACTLCLSCVSACPANALQDNPQAPQLRFVEKNCVQCGLCVGTCPENALRLQPRLWLDPQRRQPRVVNEQPAYGCIRCGTPFGTLKGVEAMLARLSGHPMFQGAAADRLKMCGDCRVIDIHTGQQPRITDL